MAGRIVAYAHARVEMNGVASNLPSLPDGVLTDESQNNDPHTSVWQSPNEA